MGNKITEVRSKLLRSGVELQGIARSDRGTKYIVGSLVIPFEPGKKHPTKEAMERGIKTLLEGE